MTQIPDHILQSMKDNRAAFEELYQHASKQISGLNTTDIESLERKMFGGTGTHRRRTDPEANAWRKVFREKLKL